MSIELSRFKFDDLGFQVCSGEVRDFFHFRIWTLGGRHREQRSFRKTVSSERTLDVDIQVPCPILKVSYERRRLISGLLHGPYIPFSLKNWILYRYPKHYKI